MRFGVEVVTLGEFADPGRVVEIAQVAEAHGWEALFVWDHLAYAWGVPSADPWVTLAVSAQATTTIKLGTFVTPLPRRRPQVVASALASLDLLSGGRVIFGAGLGGVDVEFTAFGEDADPHIRAEKLDESLDILDGLLSGRQTKHAGTHYQIDGVTLAPLPVQKPRLPIWIGGESQPAMRRAARYDGWAISGVNEQAQITKRPEQVAEGIAYIAQHRDSMADFEVAMTGISMPNDAAFVQR
jgi:probable F420-dependent oxidoreductase